MTRALRLSFTMAFFVASLTGCSGDGGGGTGGGAGGGSGGGGGKLSQFAIHVLDADAGLGPPVDGGVDAGYHGDAPYFAMAVDPVNERVGVAYYVAKNTYTQGVGVPDFNLDYIEYNNQTQSTTPVQTIRVVQRKVGLSVAFDPVSHEPVVAYLGGASGFVPGQSISWFQNDATYSVRTSGTTWTEYTVAKDSTDVQCKNPQGVVPPTEIGFLVGIWPSIVFDAQGKLVFSFRDCHNGEFPQQDWGASGVKVFTGAVGASTYTGACAYGGIDKGAYGGHDQLAMGATQPALIFDQMPGTADTNGSNVFFQRRNADGSWAPPGLVLTIANTQTGASLAYDTQGAADGGEGFGIAAFDLDKSMLYYTNLPEGATRWVEADPVFGAGSGGWYPSLAMDPVYHEPAIAFYICSNKTGIAPTACSTTEDELDVTQRISGNWRQVTVDTGGAVSPKIGFFASGKRFIVYRTPPAVSPDTGKVVPDYGALKIAVER